MGFKKKSAVKRSAAVKAANVKRGIENQARREFEEDLKAGKSSRHNVGRRIVKLMELAEKMWCNDCDVPLSFRFLTEEKQCGLASEFKIRCYMCLREYVVESDTRTPDCDGDGRYLYSSNCKAAVGCIDAGFSHEGLNKFLSALNIPAVFRNTIVRAQERVGESIVKVARDSCKEAILVEKQLTEEKQRQLSESADDQMVDEPSTPVCRRDCESLETSCDNISMSSALEYESENTHTPQRKKYRIKEVIYLTSTIIVVKYDFGWDTRGNGFAYKSHSGRGVIMGDLSGKILGYDVVSMWCSKCQKGHPPDDHDCVKNYTGSSKGMEPFSAVRLIVENEDLKKAGVVVGKLVGDRDSSTIAAVRRASDHPIEKIDDLNHNTKGFSKLLWQLKKTTQKWMSVALIDYLKRSLNYAIHQNKGKPEDLSQAIMNIANHVFGEHSECADWCKAKMLDDPSAYVFKFFPNNKAFSDADPDRKGWRDDLHLALKSQSDIADTLAPCGSTQSNESVNSMCVSKAPKNRHYCGTKANLYRVSSAVATKNIGSGYVEVVYKYSNLSPSCFNTRAHLQKRREARAEYQKRPEIKKRRLFNKMKNGWRADTDDKREGITYASGMAPAMERASAAASVVEKCWLPDECQLSEDIQYVTVDIETTGFAATADIIQLATKCGDKTFNVNILPLKRIDAKASEVTGLTVHKGKLFRHGKQLHTISAKTAASEFLKFLEECGNQVSLVGHNIIKFDGPRMLRFVRDFGDVKTFCQLVYGFVDTIPLVKQGKLGKLEDLAATYLKGEYWQEVRRAAHDALSDCILLDGLLSHFKVSDIMLKKATVTTRAFLQNQAKIKKKAENVVTLQCLKTGSVSQFMIGKMAAAGVTLEELKREYEATGRKGLEVCLGTQVDGKPRVTTQKKTLDNIEAFLISNSGLAEA